MKQIKKPFQQLLALLLCIAMLLPSVLIPVQAEETEQATTTGEPLAIVWSGSDFQYSASGNTTQQNADANKGLLQEIITAQIGAGFDSIDEALFPGDLTPSSGKDASDIGATTVLEALNENWNLTADDVIFATGNHDSGGFDLNDATGGYDREYYSVYNINYAGFPCNGSKTVVQATADALKTWLDAKAETGYAKPIFVMTHLPLHHNGRYDNYNASYIVDVLNEAGSHGLNIIFLFGHNHSGGYDRYLGGSCIYYAPGDTMLVSKVDSSVSEFEETTLNFTYMNAGYVGYVGTGESGATLSACTFEIYEDRVEITRCNKSGKTNLKNAGKHSSSYDATDADGNYLWDADTTVTTSSQTLNLSDIVLSVDSANTTLGDTLEKGNSANVAITVGGADEYTVAWESFNSGIAAVSGDGTSATITAVANGVTTVQATVSAVTAARTAGVPATIQFDVTVAADDAVQINGGEPLTLYAPIDNLYNDFDLSVKYMILNSNQLGTATAFGGADSAGNRGSDAINYVKSVKVVEFAPAGDGVFTFSADGYDTWKFEENSKYPASEYGYALRLTNVGHYVGTDKTLMPDHSTTDYKGNIRITSSLAGSSCSVTFDVVDNAAAPLETKKVFHHDGSLNIYDLTGYTLNYNSSANYFQLTESGDPVYFFKEAATINDGWMWVEGEGSIVVGGTGNVGGTLYVMIDSVVHPVPITTDMVSGVYWNVPGTYTGTVSYMGTEVTTTFPVTVTSEDGSTVDAITLIDSKNGPIYKHWNIKDDQIDSGYYYAAVYSEDNHAGEGVGQVLTLDENGNLIAVDIDMQEFTVSGATSLYIQPSENQLWYNATTINGVKAATYYFWQNKADTSKFLSVADSVPVAVDQDTAVANGANWRISTADFNLISTSETSQTIIPDGNGGWTTVGRYVNTKTHTYYLDNTLDSIIAYLDKNSGTVEVGQVGKLTPGGNIVVSTYLKDGSYTTEQIPVTVDMLNITVEQLLTPGEYTCTVTYQGKVFSSDYKLTVTGTNKDVNVLSDAQAAYLTDNSATVVAGSGGSVWTEDEIVMYTIHEDGTVTEERIPVLLNMLNATSSQLNKVGTYNGLTVTYDNMVISENYNLTVYAANVDNYPEFADEGAVKIDKWADTSIYDYFGTGTAQVNLSVTGIPNRNKANAVIIVDASSSMRICVHGGQADYADDWTDAERASFKSFLLEDITRALTAEEQALFQRLYDERFNDDERYQKAFDTRMATGESYGSEYVSRLKKWLDLTGYCSTSGKWAGMDDHECPTRERILEDSLIKMLQDFAAADENGYVPDVDIAIAYFNSYTQIDNNYLVKDTGSHFAANPTNGGEVFLDFTNSTAINDTILNSVRDDYKTTYGTNYDDAMQQAYDLLSQKQARDYKDYLEGDTTKPYEPRQDFVIFMSDGQPYQFNYFGGGSGNWSKWFNGEMDEALAEGQTYADAGFVDEAYLDVFEAYYHPDGKLWMAEAIKGDETQKYKIIDPDSNTDKHITYVNGLGATLMTVGFNLGADGGYHEVMQRIATSDSYYTACETSDDIEAAFGAFATLVRSANNAVFKDQMGSEFDLQLKATMTTGGGDPVTLDPSPMIQLKLYETWKHADEGSEYTKADGTTGTVTESMVGTRKSETATILETVIFNAAGTAAYSTHVDKDGDGNYGTVLNADGTYSINDEDDSILVDNVICAANFWYNTSTSDTKTITANGVKVNLEAETFYWNVGAITEDELVLSYFVYLTGSMEGNREEEGKYDTNKYATLTYTNYLGNACEQSVPTPVLPWNQATVGYGFYLVDKDGKPIINQTTGKTGSFEQAIRITEPIYETFALNSASTDIHANIVAKDKLPDGYQLFDVNTAYKVQMDSTGNGYYEITITKTDAENNLIETTYVVGVESTAVSGGDADGERVNTTAYATANTVVWFAVYAGVSAVPDTVVIDYGLPVEIDVMENDTMMGTNGRLTYIGATSAFADGYAAYKAEDGNTDKALWQYLQDYEVSQTPAFTSTEIPGTYGVAEVNATNGEVRYTLNDASTDANNGMQMAKEETFAYAANYTGTIGTQGYYYSTVTVIPATTIYYEDSFLTYKTYQYISDEQYKQGEAGNRTTTATEITNQWTSVGNTIEAIQAEDRPGEFSLSSIDANNIYGYDGAYTNMTEYSLGSAMKFTASAIANTEAGMEGTVTKTYGTAEFTFTGTGFDVISATSNFTGSITVDIYKGSNTDEWYDFYVVDTYYGYKWAQVDTDNNGTLDDYGWVVDESASDCLYQVPVIQANNLPYGTYTVVITVSYAEAFDHAQYADAKYDFYLDAIRIYDPANDGATSQVVQDAYIADGEGWPEYFELRNLIISKATYDAIGTDESITGIVFIDNTADTDEDKFNSIEDYTNYGPNNELYLAPGQAIAFELNVPQPENGQVAGIHMAMKSVGNVDGNGGKTATAYVKYYDAASNVAEQKATALNTATDLYYDITSLNGKTVVIANTGADTDAILSITNIKVTYTAEHTDSLENTYLTVNSDTGGRAVMSLRAAPAVEVPDETVPETTVPETTVPEATVPEETTPEDSEAFEPETFSVKVSDSSVKVGSRVLVTVTASDDVEVITVNGKTLTDYTVNRRTGIRTWKVRVPAETVGELTLEVIAYNEAGLASEPIVKTVAVTEEHTSIGSWLEEILMSFIGGIFGKWN